MAKPKVAEQYDEFAVGGDFTAEEMDGYDPQKLAGERIAWLCAQHQILMRRSQLPGTTLPAWWKDVRSYMRSVLGWYPKGMELVRVTEEEMGLDTSTLPALTTKAGKQLTLEATALDGREGEWLDAWTAEVYRVAQYAASIPAAMDEGQWSKAQNRWNNKLLNCLVGHELRAIGVLRGKLSSRTGA